MASRKVSICHHPARESRLETAEIGCAFDARVFASRSKSMLRLKRKWESLPCIASWELI